MRKAFTLIELLIVVSIISILAVIIVIAIGNAESKSRDTKRKADLQAISSALEAYKSQKGVYPNSAATGCVTDKTNFTTKFIQLDKNPQTCSAINDLVVSGYLSAFPVDPDNASPQGYFYSTKSSAGADYKIIKLNPEMLKGQTDPSKCSDIAGDFYDSNTNRSCSAYQVTSNVEATRDW
jgi:prepilin-type N-terminal cleavage/methylation domain-containing protein